MNRLVSLLCLVLAAAPIEAQDLNAKSPSVGSPAPPITANHILGAPEAKIDWPSLHGKAVVLEFWATWCVPCIAEIPLLNSLQSSVDSAKVQFISVSDEDPEVIRKFLTAHPIDGIVAVDTASRSFQAYGIVARPATILIGPDGRIVSTSAHPESLTAPQLLAIANGEPVRLSDDPVAASRNTQAMAQHDAILKEGFRTPAASNSNALFEISLSPGDPGDGHIMQRGDGQYDITNVTLGTLLDFAAHIPRSRTTFATPLPETQYNLHVQAPNADPVELAHAVELAIASAAHLSIARHTEDSDVLVLTALPGAQAHFEPASAAGMAIYNLAGKSLMCIHASPAQIGSALQKPLQKPIVDESALTGTYSDSIPVLATDLAATNKALARAGLRLTPARRPIETYTITALK